jgi:hypothetical protein
MSKIVQHESVPKEAQKLTEYRCWSIPNIKDMYLCLFNDNIVHLIDYIYSNQSKEPYDSPENRVALAMQMIMSSEQLIPVHLSTMIIKDMDTMRKDNQYTSRWVNPALKRKTLSKEIELLKKHTEIDDSMSLNLPDKSEGEKPEIADFDIHSGVSTLNVSSVCPIDEESRCILM